MSVHRYGQVCDFSSNKALGNLIMVMAIPEAQWALNAASIQSKNGCGITIQTVWRVSSNLCVVWTNRLMYLAEHSTEAVSRAGTDTLSQYDLETGRRMAFSSALSYPSGP